MHLEFDLLKILACYRLLDVSYLFDSLFIRFANIDLLENGVQKVLVL